MAELDSQEYRSLRDAVAARGHLRATLALAGVSAWALVLVATLAWLPSPLAAVVPLLVLIATFEVIRPLHVGAERIGRYLQVFHEEGRERGQTLAAPAWERTAMAFGAAVPGAAGHPLFVPVLGLATLVNTFTIWVPGPVPVEMVLLAIPHGAFLLWMARADHAMRAQRDRELARFRELRNGEGSRS
ncbi:MAG: hypothetical protein IT179_18560 [Acidobacteria bacterium]|nr:hypothetical protein [Acidobacteriota bacterium]